MGQTVHTHYTKRREQSVEFKLKLMEESTFWHGAYLAYVTKCQKTLVRAWVLDYLENVSELLVNKWTGRCSSPCFVLALSDRVLFLVICPAAVTPVSAYSVTVTHRFYTCNCSLTNKIILLLHNFLNDLSCSLYYICLWESYPLHCFLDRDLLQKSRSERIPDTECLL